jgi:hypothetical protein
MLAHRLFFPVRASAAITTQTQTFTSTSSTQTPTMSFNSSDTVKVFMLTQEMFLYNRKRADFVNFTRTVQNVYNRTLIQSIQHYIVLILTFHLPTTILAGLRRKYR